MGGYNDLKTAIAALIHTNDNQEITGDTLQSALLSIINAIGQGSVFKGVATTSTNPGSPDANVFYIAGSPGYYPNFNLELTAGLHVIENKSGIWVNTEIALDVVDAINIGGAKHVKPSQAMLINLQSVEQIPDSEGRNNKMWWSTDGNLKYKQNDTVYNLGAPAYVLYYCGDKIYKWTGSGFREIGGGGNAGQITNINDGQNYRIWVGTQEDLDALNGVFEDDVIYLVGTIPQAVTKFNVSTSGLTHCTVPNGTPTKVVENNPFTVVVSPESGYTIDSCQATMGNTTIQGVALSGADTGKYQIAINAVTANISISASASVHLQSIAISTGTRSGNAIQMSAALTPVNAENVSLQWLVSGSQYVNINPSTGVLTILEGASNESVTVICTDANSGISKTLQLTGLTYNDVISSLTAIGATRIGTNTVTLNADGRTSGVNFSLQSPVPKVNYVRRWEAGDEVDGETKAEAGHDLVEIPAVTLNGNTLIYKGDCTVRVKATAATDSSITCTNDIVITHDNADQIWFEDVETLKAVNDKSIGATTGSVLTRTDDPTYAGCVTYAQAAAVSAKNSLVLNNTKMIAFNEFKWFVSIVNCVNSSAGTRYSSFNQCTNLEYIELPTSPTFEALGGGLQGTKIKKIVVPSNITSLSGTVFDNPELEYAEINAAVGALTYDIFASTCTGLKECILGNGITSIPTSLFEGCSALEKASIGSGISTLPNRAFRNCSKLKDLTLKYKGASVVGFNSGDGSSATFYPRDTILNQLTLRVPGSLLSSYQEDTNGWKITTNGTINIVAMPGESTVNPGEGGQS